MVELSDIYLTYQAPDGEVPALAGITFDVAEGEFISIVGPSGCGKSTLLNAIAGLETPDSGSLLVDGHPLRGPDPAVGYMPQKDGLLPWRTIFSNLCLGLEIAGKNTPARQAEVRELLARYGLSEFAGKTPSQLSGGMRQRCALIRTLASGPKLLLLDEAFSALDYQTRLAVSEDIHNIIRREGKTAILVTHDISEAVSLSDRILLLTRRPARIKHIYSLDALRGIPPLARRDHPAFREFFNAIWKELDLHV